MYKHLQKNTIMKMLRIYDPDDIKRVKIKQIRNEHRNCLLINIGYLLY